MTGPKGNSEFRFTRISMSECWKDIEINGKQNSLFPSGPVIKCLLLHHEFSLTYNPCTQFLYTTLI